MRDKDKILILKILKYIKEVKDFIEGYNQEQFYNDRKTINACVFNLSQIGELVEKISDETIKENPRYRMERIKIFKK